MSKVSWEQNWDKEKERSNQKSERTIAPSETASFQNFATMILSVPPLTASLLKNVSYAEYT